MVYKIVMTLTANQHRKIVTQTLNYPVINCLLSVVSICNRLQLEFQLCTFGQY